LKEVFSQPSRGTTLSFPPTDEKTKISEKKIFRIIDRIEIQFNNPHIPLDLFLGKC